MKHLPLILSTAILLAASCTSQKKLAYLNNLPEVNGEENFTMTIPDYKIQPRDILYITIKAMTPDGSIKDFLSSGISNGINISQSDAGGALLVIMSILKDTLPSKQLDRLRLAD